MKNEKKLFITKGGYWRIAIVALAVVLSVVSFLPNTPLFQKMPQWWQESMPDRGIVLGLDLQGGSHLVFEVKTERTVEIVTERIASSLSNTFEEKGIQAHVKVDGLFVIVSPDDMDIRKIMDIRTIIEDVYPTLSLSEISEDALKYRLTEREVREIGRKAVEQTVENIRDRIDLFGVTEPIIHKQAGNEVVVQLPGIKDFRRAVEIIGKTAHLEFKLVDDESPFVEELPPFIPLAEEAQFLEEIKDRIPKERIVLFQRDLDVGISTPFLLKEEALLTGGLLTEAKMSVDRMSIDPYHVSIAFCSEGAKIFKKVTGQNVGERLAIVLDDNVRSAPVIREEIAGGRAQITGTFTMAEAIDLSIALRAGALPAPVEMIKNVTVGPTLGKDSIEAGKIASIIAMLLVIAFMITYYRLSGIIASVALTMNMTFLFGIMAALNATLTLPGIAGIVLVIGMAVDANVLMFERMREELRTGKNPKSSVKEGRLKALSAILDSHVTVIIAALILFLFSTGPVQGFALTLGVGVALNLFTTLVATRTALDIMYHKRGVEKLSI
ncbi:protein translocase subunit SecD [Thermodesulfovibrionales bacterium]|nr:protein translocase subunit SecD [Thermodesulfovibrionales bacterium]